MILRRKVGPSGEKENVSPESSRSEQGKINKASRRSPLNQRRREKAERNSINKRDAPREQSTEPFIREGKAVDGFLLAQRAIKSRIGSAFQQLRENEARNKDDFDQEADGHDETTKARRLSSPATRSSSARRPSSTRRSSRHGVEKRKHFQDVMTELKTKVWKTGKETSIDGALQQNVTELISGETHYTERAVRSASDRLLCERSFVSPHCSTGGMGAWFARPAKLQKSAAESAGGHHRRSPFRFDNSSRGGSGFFGSSGVQLPSLPTHLGEDFLGQPSSLDTKISQWGRTKGRRPPRRKNAPLRRAKSSNSLQTQRGSGLFWDIPDVLKELSAESSLLDQIQEIRSSLEASEKALNEFIAESSKNRADILEQVDRLTTLYSSLSQSQDIRYRSLLDVFHENYKLLGYVESNFDYVLSVVARGRRSNLQGRFYDLLRFIADHTMAPILCVVRFASRFYLRFFPRRTEPNN